MYTVLPHFQGELEVVFRIPRLEGHSSPSGERF